MLQRRMVIIGVAASLAMPLFCKAGQESTNDLAKVALPMNRTDYPRSALSRPASAKGFWPEAGHQLPLNHVFVSVKSAASREVAVSQAWLSCHSAVASDDQVSGAGSSAGAPDPALFPGPDLEQAIAVLLRSQRRTLYLHTGLYRLAHPLLLTTAADGLRLIACPGETPVIEAASGEPAVILAKSRDVSISHLVFAGAASVTLLLDGVRDSLIEHNVFMNAKAGILLDHAVGNRIERNIVVGMDATGIELKDASDDNVVSDNMIDAAGAPETFGGGIFLHGVRNNRIAHNLVQNSAGFGIGISNWNEATVNYGNIVEFNLLRRTALTATDSGAIYILGRSGADTGTVIAGNVVDGVGANDRHTVGIYLDDSTSGAIVIRNLLRGIGSDGVEIHGGSDNLIENNLFDLGQERPSAILFQAAPADTHPSNLQTGNSVIGNIVISANASPRFFVWYDGGTPLVSGNFYATLTGTGPQLDGPVIDHAPVLGDLATIRPTLDDNYEAVQQAASLIGFKRIDTTAAGIRPDGAASPQ